MNWEGKEGVCNVRLTTGTKLTVFESNVKIVLLYAVEMWRLTKELNQKLRVFF